MKEERTVLAKHFMFHTTVMKKNCLYMLQIPSVQV